LHGRHQLLDVSAQDGAHAPLGELGDGGVGARAGVAPLCEVGLQAIGNACVDTCRFGGCRRHGTPAHAIGRGS